MTPPTSPTRGSIVSEAPDFSVVQGGPLFQLFRRAHLTDDALSLLHKRIVVVSLLGWLPLLVLSALEGRLLPGSAILPFLTDFEIHIRFLVAVPLLIAAEPAVHRRMLPLVRQFLDRDLVPEDAQARFDAAVESVTRVRNSAIAEVALISFVYIVGVLIVWRNFVAIDASTWYATPSGAGISRSLAGTWFGFVSLPIFQFLLVRWYFRIAIWARFLWQVSRIKLRLAPVQPDRVGGLGFLSLSVYPFTLIALAHGVLLAGAFASRILFVGGSLTSFAPEVVVVVLWMMLLVFGPLLFFAPQLAETKRAALGDYGVFAQRYSREFDTKWVRGGAPPGEPLLGTSDIQSLADLNSSLLVVKRMSVVPIGRDAVIQLAGATLAPILPLVLTMMPLSELMKRLVKLVV